MKEFKNYYGHGFAYNTYVCGNDKLFPNSKDEMNKKEEQQEEQQEEETRLVITFNVSSTNNATDIMNSSAISQFSEIEIDGVVQPNVVDSYTFDTTGEHIVKYTLADPTTIGTSAFYMRYNIKSVIIPNNVTSIDNSAFGNCNGLTDVVLGSGLTNINTAFTDCYNLTNITSLATTAPTIKNDTFKSIKSGGILTVPADSTGYHVWMETDNYYLGKYGWNIIEQ